MIAVGSASTVTCVAVLTTLGSAVALGVGLLTLIVPALLPVQLAPVRTRMASIALVYIAAGVWGLGTGIGLFRRREWARISTVVFAALLTLAAAAAILALALSPYFREMQAISGLVTGVRIVLAAFSLVPLGAGAAALTFFTRPAVKEQFAASR